MIVGVNKEQLEVLPIDYTEDLFRTWVFVEEFLDDKSSISDRSHGSPFKASKSDLEKIRWSKTEKIPNFNLRNLEKELNPKITIVKGSPNIADREGESIMNIILTIRKRIDEHLVQRMQEAVEEGKQKWKEASLEAIRTADVKDREFVKEFVQTQMFVNFFELEIK